MNRVGISSARKEHAQKNRIAKETSIGNDGASLMGDLHSQVTLPSSTAVEASPLDQDFNELVGGKWVDNIKSGSEKAKTIVKDGGSAIGKIFESLGDITKFGINKTAHNQPALTIISGLGGATSGIFALKNILKTAKTFMDPKSDNSPWIIHGLMSILQGGLAVGLTSPFTGAKNPFMKVVNGKNIVPLKMIIGAIGGIFGVKLFIDSAAGVGLAVKLPVAGKQVQDITGTVNDAAKHITTNTENVPGGQGTGINPAQFAQAA